MSKAIKLTMPDTLVKQTEKNVKDFGYTNIQEITLEALRNLNAQLEIQAFHKKHYKTYSGKRPSREDRAELAESLIKLKKL